MPGAKMMAQRIRPGGWHWVLAPITICLLAACASDDGRRTASSPNVETDIDATRNTGPTSADPGALRGSRNPFLSTDANTAEEQAPTTPVVRAGPGPPTIGIGAVTQDTTAPGTARAGLAFALDNCRPCHVVAPTSAAVRFANAPEFMAIANDARTTPLGLTVWLTNPHPTMPTLVLSPQEARDVIAYILSLREKP